MRKLIGFVCTELGFKFVENKVIGGCSILAWKNERVTKVDEIGIDIWHWEHLFDRMDYGSWDIFAEYDSRFIPVRQLT
jgi:hypothetical protein